MGLLIKLGHCSVFFGRLGTSLYRPKNWGNQTKCLKNSSCCFLFVVAVIDVYMVVDN